jgi:hypothetical protein
VKALSGGVNNKLRNNIQKAVFVAPSSLWMKRYKINLTTCFSSIEITGRSVLLRYEYSKLQQAFNWLMQSNLCPSWTLENMPSFEVKCLSPMPKLWKIYYNTNILCQVSDEDYWTILAEAEEKTGCIFKRDPSTSGWRELRSPGKYEVGFYGTRSQVEEATKLLKASFMSDEDRASYEADAKRGMT